jgi:tetraacyldisaccharide 4'-kinase
VVQILDKYPETNLIILDDALQHRRVTAHINILLTEFHNLYPSDALLPYGGLRDEKRSSGRADIIVVTKCPSELTAATKSEIARKLGPGKGQRVFFSMIGYQEIYEAGSHRIIKPTFDYALSFAAIANTRMLAEYTSHLFRSSDVISFRDHARYDETRYREIADTFNAAKGEEKVLLTTEKDLVKIDHEKLNSMIAPYKLCVLPIKTLFSEGELFIHTLQEGISAYEKV